MKTNLQTKHMSGKFEKGQRPNQNLEDKAILVSEGKNS